MAVCMLFTRPFNVVRYKLADQTRKNYAGLFRNHGVGSDCMQVGQPTMGTKSTQAQGCGRGWWQLCPSMYVCKTEQQQRSTKWVGVQSNALNVRKYQNFTGCAILFVQK